MPHREAPHPVIWIQILCLLLPLSRLEAKARSAAALDSSYVSALSAANRFLQAWQAGDAESGMVLLSSHAKESATAESVEKFFANRQSCAYEITRGKSMRHDRYVFPVALLSGGGAKNSPLRRRVASIIVVNTGNNEWAVDRLPYQNLPWLVQERLYD